MLKKIRNINILIQYSVLTFLIIAVISTAIYVTIEKRLMTSTIDTHVRIYPDIVSIIASENADLIQSFKDKSQLSDNQIHLVKDFLNVGSVFRVKVWSVDAVVLWSDQKDIIGKKYPDNENFDGAISGNVTYSIEKPEEHILNEPHENDVIDENMTEIDYGTILEIYTPVYYEDEIIGVIELYEPFSDLQAPIDDIVRKSQIIIYGLSLIMYLIQFGIFYDSYSKLNELNMQLTETKDVTINALATLAETRNNETGAHLKRTSEYVRLIAEELRKTPKYRKQLDSKYITEIVKAAPLHDIGKVGIRDSILLKKGKLTEEEFEEIKKHCEIGAQTLEQAEANARFKSFFTTAKQITKHHHEKWDGSGYPEGLSGEDIPISARIMALADVYDALRSKRPYKEAFSHEISMEIIKADVGKHFDPMVVEAFLKQEELVIKTSKIVEYDYT